MTITPDQAAELLAGTTHGPWRALHDQWEDEDGTTCEDFYVLGVSDGILYAEDFDPDTHNPVANTTLAATAPDLAQTIAGMTEQWRAEYREIRGAWLAVSDWTTEDKARLALAPDQFKDATTRLVRRLVGPVEEVTE